MGKSRRLVDPMRFSLGLITHLMNSDSCVLLHYVVSSSPTGTYLGRTRCVRLAFFFPLSSSNKVRAMAGDLLYIVDMVGERGLGVLPKVQGRNGFTVCEATCHGHGVSRAVVFPLFLPRLDGPPIPFSFLGHRLDGEVRGLVVTDHGNDDADFVSDATRASHTNGMLGWSPGGRGHYLLCSVMQGFWYLVWSCLFLCRIDHVSWCPWSSHRSRGMHAVHREGEGGVAKEPCSLCFLSMYCSFEHVTNGLLREDDFLNGRAWK